MARLGRLLCVLSCVLLGALFVGCSDDSNPPASDSNPPASDGLGVDAPRTDGPPVVGDMIILDWTHQQQQDTVAFSCTPGEADMCDGYKTQYCANGTCTACPANMVDCDRTGDCECFGACDGTKCVGGGGN